MQTELTPKQQVSELIRQANNILLVTGREPNTDQLASVVAAQTILTRLGKQVQVIVSDRLPKAAELFHTDLISKDLTGIRDFIIKLPMRDVEIEKLKYQVNDGSLDIIITPHNGNFKAEDAHFEYGAFQFDLVIAVGVPQIARLDRILETNPTIFDGLHLLNIDYHRINENYGSVNYVDTAASSVCEMLISVFESLGQGLVDEYVATAILAGIMSATANFTAPQTTAKAMTMAAQMIAAGGRQQEVVRVLQGGGRRSSDHKVGGHETPKPQPVAAVEPKPEKFSDKVIEKLEEKAAETAEAKPAEQPKVVEEVVPEPAEQKDSSTAAADDAATAQADDTAPTA